MFVAGEVAPVFLFEAERSGLLEVLTSDEPWLFLLFFSVFPEVLCVLAEESFAPFKNQYQPFEDRADSDVDEEEVDDCAVFSSNNFEREDVVSGDDPVVLDDSELVFWSCVELSVSFVANPGMVRKTRLAKTKTHKKQARFDIERSFNSTYHKRLLISTASRFPFVSVRDTSLSLWDVSLNSTRGK